MTEKTLNLKWTNVLGLEKDHVYHVVSNLTCWDLLELMETEHITVDYLLDICYPPLPPVDEEELSPPCEATP
jgi:hypothetical protein